MRPLNLQIFPLNFKLTAAKAAFPVVPSQQIKFYLNEHANRFIYDNWSGRMQPESLHTILDAVGRTAFLWNLSRLMYVKRQKMSSETFEIKIKCTIFIFKLHAATEVLGDLFLWSEPLVYRWLYTRLRGKTFCNIR